MWMSSRPTSIGAAPSMRASRSFELSHAIAGLGVGEALQDHPIDLRGRARRHHGLLDEARESRDDGAGLLLPAGEGLGAFRPHARLRDDGDRALYVCRSRAGHALLAAHVSPVSLPKMRSGVNGRCGKRTPVALSSAFDDRGRDRIDRALALRLGAERSDLVVGVGEEHLGRRHVRERRDAVVAQRRVHHGAARRRPCSRSAPSRTPCAMAPSIWPRHCIGLMSRPISAPCTLCRMRISPVMR